MAVIAYFSQLRNFGMRNNYITVESDGVERKEVLCKLLFSVSINYWKLYFLYNQCQRLKSLNHK